VHKVHKERCCNRKHKYLQNQNDMNLEILQIVYKKIKISIFKIVLKITFPYFVVYTKELDDEKSVIYMHSHIWNSFPRFLLCLYKYDHLWCMCITIYWLLSVKEICCMCMMLSRYFLILNDYAVWYLLTCPSNFLQIGMLSQSCNNTSLGYLLVLLIC
jgi:hypothetical protein